ncbi:MAG TPA: protein kinase [Thermoanaerobaculia bacterium]|nr:protein kinase [Thermoanaerobaculia bacterium]
MTATTNPNRQTGPSLGTRVFLVTFLLIALSVGTAVAVTSFLVRRIARNAAHEALASSSSVQEIVQGQARERLKLISRLMVGDPYLAAYIAQASGEMDTASILDLLTTKQQDLGFDFAILLDPTGRVIARTDRLNAAGQDLSHRPLVAKALADLDVVGIWEENGRLYDTSIVHIQSPDFQLLGFMVTGLAITDQSARGIQEVSGTDVALVSLGQEGPKIVATTLPQKTARSLADSIGSRDHALGRALQAGQKPEETEIELDGEPWMAVVSPLGAGEGRPVGATIALASLRKELSAYREIETVLLLAGLVSALLGGLLGFALARRTLAPLRQLAAAAEAARQGDYDPKISTGRTDEVGRLSRAFDELLADLREKRDMEAYVTELSRNLPEPSQGRAIVGGPQSREILVMGIDLRRYARATANGGPQDALDQLTEDLKRVTTAVGAQRGQLEGVIGHRVLASFIGDSRGRRALQAAAQVLAAYADGDPSTEELAPAVALASGRTVTGPVTINDQMERALVGLPVQQIDALLREATPGELLLSREVHDELRGAFEQAGYQLAQRRGVLTPQPLYAMTASLAARLTGLRGLGGLGGLTADGREAVTPPGGHTLSGIAPGALMGQRFEILSVLGAGGMGVVYKARDRELDDLVALKMLKKEQLVDRTQLDRLKSEIKLARKITHPNVLRTFDFGEIDGIPYISMEYVRGVTLRYMLDQTKRLPYSAGLRLAKQLCAGLAAAHAVGVLHRDIKPENLILEPNGNAKLMDFGIARPINRMEPGQTQAGMIVGTPLYLSPELLQGQEVDARADVYSCGVVLYEIFAGSLPFQGANAMEIMLKHLREQPVPPRVHWPEIPPKLEQLILRCLAKEPEERYRSVEDLLHDLETLSA